MAMAILVMWMVSARFNKTAAEYRSRVAQVHRADVSRFGAAYVAFMLGISNMRRRKLRTAMTLITLTLLTFSVLSFTSFEDRIRFVGLPAPFEGEREGLLIRDRNWGKLSYPVWDYARSHFGSEAILTPRYWHSGLEGEVRYVEVRRGERVARALGMVGLDPGERLVTGVDRCLVAGSFFEEGDEATCLLPDEMAEALGISAADVGSVRVSVFGRDLVVRGIFSAAALDDVRDLDGGSLTPIDTRVAAFDPLDELLEEGMEGEEEAVVEMTAALHLPAANVLITPDRTQRDFGGALRSVGGRFREDARPAELIEKYLLRVAAFMYAGIRDDAGGIFVYRFSSVGLTSVQGLGALAIPAVIAAMIVLNAMLGAVYERFREIGIYSSVGLAPVHISVLFLAEATVYAILGVTMGYLLGQGLGKLLIALDMLSGITLNYSLVSAVVAALSVMAIVLLSTLHPARVAARVAVPEAVRRWRPPDPDGDRWDFAFPVQRQRVRGRRDLRFPALLLHRPRRAPSAAGCTPRGWSCGGAQTPAGASYRIDFRMWLAPYDLGVSEEVGIELAPAEGAPGMYAIAIGIERVSGEQLNWRRLNGPFFNVLRRQLLIWNTLPAADPRRAPAHR